MSGPLIFNSRSRVKPGKVELYRAHVSAATELVESEEPQMIAFNSYESADGTDVCTVQIHPDADSLDTHFKLYRERLMERSVEALDTYEINVFGTPSKAAREFLEQYAAHTSGLLLRVLPVHAAGFLRPQPM
jgi:hypothetical protein